MIKKILKGFGKYFTIFLSTVVILLLLLVLVAKIPRKYIDKNLKDSESFFLDKRNEITRLQNKRDYTYLHPYADSIILNIIYCLDSNHPLKSVMEDKYYKKNDNLIYNTKEIINVIDNNLEGNTEYLRYWHGSIIIIKPLLMLLNIQGIYKFFKILLMILIIAILIILIKKKYILLAVAFGLSLIATSFTIVPLCLEYIWAYLLMLIVSLISIFIEKKGDNKLFTVFFISGILTCFFDFLTTETLTILVPIVIVIAIRYKDKRLTSFKEGLIFIIKSILIWGISYSVMWLAKWCIAAMVLKINVIPFIKDKALLRINGKFKNMTQIELCREAINRNIFTLYPINIVKRRTLLLFPLAIFLIFQAIFIDKKDKKKWWLFLLLLVVGVIPYIRYAFLANHSYGHYYLTFRAQFPTVMCLIISFVYTLDEKKFFYDIKLNKNKNLEVKNQSKKVFNKELTILIPALNEEKTIKIVIEKAKKFIANNNIDGEVIVVNNLSTDNTKQIALNCGARVIDAPIKGYGSALIQGIRNANGKYIIMGDADDSYNFLELDDFIKYLRLGFNIVIGNRLTKDMEKGAMKFTHRYIGTPILTYLVNVIYKTDLTDINCGLRGFNTQKVLELNCNCIGMEFASEMIIKAAKNNLKIKEIPIKFYKDKREKKSHLSPIKDGMDHLKIILKNTY